MPRAPGAVSVIHDSTEGSAATVSFAQCTFGGNSANGGGGALYARSPISVTSTLIAANTAASQGGGVYLDSTTALFKSR